MPMKPALVNIALLFGFFGFLFYLFLIIAGFLGCCTGMTTSVFYKVAGIVLIISVILFGICAYNNCCNINRAEKAKKGDAEKQ